MAAGNVRSGVLLRRLAIGLLGAILLAALYLWANPGALRSLLVMNLPAGEVDVPDFGPTPPAAQIDAPRGDPPAGYLALGGSTTAGAFGCGFLLELESGQRVGVSTAHSTQPLAQDQAGKFSAPDGSIPARVRGQLAIGQTFSGQHFSQDYALWSLGADAPGPFLRPDPRGLVQVGEAVWLIAQAADGAGSSRRWAGTVLASGEESGWLRTNAGFDPHGYSGCPVVSQHTGRLIGMAVAGIQQGESDLIGFHPVGSLAARAEEHLPLTPP